VTTKRVYSACGEYKDYRMADCRDCPKYFYSLLSGHVCKVDSRDGGLAYLWDGCPLPVVEVADWEER